MVAPIAVLIDTVRVRRFLRPLRQRDRIPAVLFATGFIIYYSIGHLIGRFDGFDGFRYFNLFFNADPPRVVLDVANAGHSLPTIAASAAHPLLVILTNPLGGILARICDSSVQATLLMCHVAAALAVVYLYLLLRELSVQAWLATAGALGYVLSTTSLILGSIPETASFASFAIAAALWLSVRARGLVRLAAANVAMFGFNAALLPHALLATPVLWVGSFAPRRWFTRVAALWLLSAALCVSLYLLQRHLHPSINMFHPWGYQVYDNFVAAPQTAADLAYRWACVGRHFFAFSMVAAEPFVTEPPQWTTTFMWHARQAIASYRHWLGIVTVGLWLVLVSAAAGAHVWHWGSMSARQRAMVVLVVTWMLGAAGFFTFFGDDLLLFSFFWMLHLTVFVTLGLSVWIARAGVSEGLPKIAAGVFLIALAIHQGTFVAQMLHYYVTHLPNPGGVTGPSQFF
jgi:hypothetical protein